MAKQKNGKKSKFVMLEWYMIDSAPWKRLDSKAVWVYVQLRRKFNGKNIDNLSLTYKEVKNHMAPATFSKAIKQLTENNFIEIIRPGGLYNTCTIYGLSEKWRITS